MLAPQKNGVGMKAVLPKRPLHLKNWHPLKKTSSAKKMANLQQTSFATPAASATPAPSSSAAAASSASARPSAGKPGSAAASPVSKRSHDKNTPCHIPDCEFCGTDLPRHLYVHVKKGELAEDSISQIITIARAGDRQFGSQIARKGKKPLRGKQRKWCPVPVCNAIVIDVGRHLVNPLTHGIAKNSHEYQHLLRLAKPYMGLAEMEGNLFAPAPTILEQRQDSSASCSLSATHPHADKEDSVTEPPAPSVSASTAHPSARDEVSASQPPAASASETAANAADSQSAKPTSATPSAAVPRSASVTASNAADSQSAKPTSATPSALVPRSPAQSCQGSPPPAPSASEQPEEVSEGCADDAEEDFAAAQGSAMQYFTCTSPKTNRHRWLVVFYQYLTRPTAGDKKQAIHLQHATQMRKLLEAIDPGGDDITCLLANEGDVDWSGWVKPHLKAATKKPGTLISYLTSYEKFLSFVTQEWFNKTAPPIHPNHLPTFGTILKDLKGSQSVVDAQSYQVKNQRMVDETEGLLTLEELQEIKTFAHYNDAVRLAIQAGRGKDLTLAVFVMVRDLLVMRFSLDTGTRPGPLNNATMGEYGKGKVKDQCKVMLVAKHKRVKGGPAICPMLPQLHKLMSIYIKYIRPHFAKPEEEVLFVTNEGVVFREGTIGKRFTAYVAKCGVNLAGRMAFVDMRKVITTEMLKQASPEEREILHRLLAHSERTSKQWYSRPDLTDTGIQAVRIIEHLLDPDEKANFAAQPGPSSGAVPARPTKSLPPSSSGVRPAAQPGTSWEAAKPVKRPTKPTKSPPPSSSGAVAPSKHVDLTAMQKEALTSIFGKEVRAGQTVTMAEVKEHTKNHPILSVLTTKDSHLKQVVNFVNYQAKTLSLQGSPPSTIAPVQTRVTNWLKQVSDRPT